MDAIYLEQLAKTLETSAAALRQMAKVQRETQSQLPAVQEINDLNLSVRARKLCARNDIKTLADLASKSAEEINAMKNSGITTMREFREVLAAHGMTLRGESVT